jgi:predicted MPP superfamily phosphohydrolase
MHPRNIQHLMILLIASTVYLYLFYRQQFQLSYIDVHLNFTQSPQHEVLKIIQISDIHMSHNQQSYKHWRELEQVVHLISVEKPDLVLITGDFVDHANRSSAELVRDYLLKNITRALGGVSNRVFGVIGNHDHKSQLISVWDKSLPPKLDLNEIERKELVVSTLEQNNDIKILENDYIFMKDKNVLLIGFGDPFTFEHASFSPQTLIAKLNTTNAISPFTIVMSHNPDTATCMFNVSSEPTLFNITDYIEERPLLKQRIQFMNDIERREMCQGLHVDLQLSGHTHGGQVSIPGTSSSLILFLYQKVYSLAPFIADKFNSVFHVVRHMELSRGIHKYYTPLGKEHYLYVNSGIHTSKGIRLFCPPEVTIFHIKHE